MTAQKIKEVKQYAKADAKWWIRKGKEYADKYPQGVKDYYAEIVANNEARAERLKTQFGYDDESLQERAEIYNEAFWSSYQWWQKKQVEIEKVILKYNPIFKEAEEFAKKVDVSDITDGFPCGGGVLYLATEMQNTDLGRALSSLYDGDSYSKKVCYQYVYKLPIKIPSYGQCVAFDERVMEAVVDFLEARGIKASVHTYID